MDTTKTITHLGLCAGYGGIELGLKRVIPNLRSVALCEIEAFAVANLVAKMEAGLMDCAPIWTDLKTFPWESFRDRVDILTGGYPCQPFSAAGKRAGTDDPRHLWPWIADGIRILRPRMCFFENVEGHISLGLREVIGELEQIGYTTAWGIFSAAECGAPHQRKRVFILAYDKSVGIQGCGADWLQEPRPYAGQRISVRGGDAGCGELANSGRIEPQGWCGAADGQQSGAGRIPRCEFAPRHDQVWPSRPGEPQHAWEPPRVVGNTLLHGHTASEVSRSTSQSEIEGGMQEPEGGSAAVGNAAAEGLQRCGTSSEMDNKSRGAEGEGCESPPAPSFPSDAHGGEAMWNTNSQRSQERTGQRGAGIQGTDTDGGADADGQAQPPLGRDADGTAGGLGYAELCVSCDNRTDELRLLGNGVVPTTATRAFLTLMEELNK